MLEVIEMAEREEAIDMEIEKTVSRETPRRFSVIYLAISGTSASLIG
jgi:hypothetical protein